MKLRGRRKATVKQLGMVLHAEPEQTLFPYDETLLERACSQWQFGDWQSLAQLNRDTLQHHPDRAMLALLAAAGRLQAGNNTEEAKKLIRLAQDWGIGKKLISQILIAGVHNSIGRAAAIGNQQQRSLQHFENVILIGIPIAEKRLFVQIDINQQIQQLAEAIKLITHSKIIDCTDNNKGQPSQVPQTLKLDTSGANILINGLALTEHSKKRWPYFLKIEEVQIAAFLILVKKIKPSFFFDIGANVGFYSLIAKKYFPELRCFAFEPTPETYNNLVSNLNENQKCSNADAFQIALSSKKGVIEFGDFGDCSGKNAILTTSIHEEKDIKKKFTVKTDSLDNLYPEILGCIIIKIDTEGHEIDVIKGGVNVLTKNKVVLQVETGHKDNFEELDSIIRSCSLDLLFRLGPDSYYTNIQNLLNASAVSEILEMANQFMILHRWDQELELSQ
jgi:FkbM family methyltransferase